MDIYNLKTEKFAAVLLFQKEWQLFLCDPYKEGGVKVWADANNKYWPNQISYDKLEPP